MSSQMSAYRVRCAKRQRLQNRVVHDVSVRMSTDERALVDARMDVMRVTISNDERALVDSFTRANLEYRDAASTNNFDDHQIEKVSVTVPDGLFLRPLTIRILDVERRRVDDQMSLNSINTRRHEPTQRNELVASLVEVVTLPDPTVVRPVDPELPARGVPVVPNANVRGNTPRRGHAVNHYPLTYGTALLVQPVENSLTFSLGTRDHPHLLTEKCKYCAAEFFAKETRSRSGDYNMCCSFGKVNIPLLKECPPELVELLSGDDRRSIHFRNNIRSANTMFAMASFKTSGSSNRRQIGQGHWCYHVCGQIYHFTNPIPGLDARQHFNIDRFYNQFYFLEYDEAINRRVAFLNDRVDLETVRVLELMLRRVNPLVRSYFSMGEVIREQRLEDIRRGQMGVQEAQREIFLAFGDQMPQHLRNYALPAAHNEVAAVFVGEEPPQDVDLVIYERDRGLNNRRSGELRNLNPLADPMVYPILFPNGEFGYQINIRLCANPRSLEQRRGRKEPIVIDRPHHATGPDRNEGNNFNIDYNLPIVDDQGNDLPGRQPRRRYVTLRQFYRYRIMIRRPLEEYDDTDTDNAFQPTEFSTLHYGGKLFQQYLVDAWLRAETNQLWWVKQNQKTLRKANYEALEKYLDRRARNIGGAVGKIVVLPRSFTGGPRHMNRCYLDAMTVVANHGKPDFFITFTCNPNWLEIKNNLGRNQKFENRPDLVCRVFHAKLLELINDLYHRQVFGVARNYMYAIEFQKRGLPHAHILLTLSPESKINAEEDIDAAVQAAFPKREEEPRLFEYISRHMTHQPCGLHNPSAPCMKDDRCTKSYPKRFRARTDTRGDDARLNQPEYRRPEDGRGYVSRNNYFIDNQWVVPFNRHLLVKFDCHLNVECCGSLKSIKYLHKYIHKGSDYCIIKQAEARQGDNGTASDQPVIDWDEVKHYEDCRYVSSMEATWRLLEFPLHDRSHAVNVLPVHLPGQQEVIFDIDDNAADILQHAQRRTKLEAWFLLNEQNPESRVYKYQEMAKYYTWSVPTCEWQLRRNNLKTLGCLAEVRPDAGELFYLRVLLSHIRGATSYEHLRTVNGVIYGTFLEACRANNLLFNVDEYERCMNEAVLTRSPFRLRALFALVACVMVNNGMDPEMITALWHRFKDELIADFLVRGDNPDQARLKALYHVKTTVLRLDLGRGVVNIQQIGLPDVDLNDPLFRGVNVDIDDSRVEHIDDNVFHGGRGGGETTSRIDTLNTDQLSVFNGIMEAVERYEHSGPLFNGNLFYVDGPGGTGKTYLYNVLLNEIESRYGSIRRCVAVAWTGIAATLLRGGRTAHSTFRIPFQSTSNSNAGHALDSEQSQIIRNAVLIIWDEAPMTHRKSLELVDRYLQHLMNRLGVPMGGKIVVFGGDFRQLLPVIPRAHPGQIIDASLKCWAFWGQVKVYQLRENVRAKQARLGSINSNLAYAQYLLSIGNGTACCVVRSRLKPRDLIELPRECVVPDRETLVNFVYDVIDEGRAILCPTNVAVNEINAIVLTRLAGQSVTYFSVDQYIGNEDEDMPHVPQDFLHAIDIPSLGPHELTLKVGALVLLIRNIDLSNGLCNGTRLRVLCMREHMLECEILTGSAAGHRGKVVYLPKMNLVASSSSGTNLPGPIKRLQFPIRLAFAMTINKSQGQTFNKVGIYLPTPCFTHGQLYVALSRVGSLSAVKVCVRNSVKQGAFHLRSGQTFTPNIVFQKIVQQMVLVNDRTSEVRPEPAFSDRPVYQVGDGRGDNLTQDDDQFFDADLGFSQFYSDDEGDDLIEAIDCGDTDLNRMVVINVPVNDRESEVAVGNDEVSRGAGYFVTSTDAFVFPKFDPYSSWKGKTPAKRIKRCLQNKPSATIASMCDNSQQLPIIREDPNLPHIEMPARVSTGTEAGTSGVRQARTCRWSDSD